MSCCNHDRTFFYNYNYPLDFFTNLQDEVRNTLARFINRHKDSKKLDLNIPFNKEAYLKLSHYDRIIEKMKQGQVCFCNSEINEGQVIQVIKNNINKI